MKTMNVLLLIAAAWMFTGCATFGEANHDNEWHRIESQYRADCEQWDKTAGVRITTKKPGEELWSVKDVIAKRCSERPDDCSPPTKPRKLVEFENVWGEPLTGENCSSYHFDEDRRKVYYQNMSWSTPDYHP